ncbi:MAG TPA: hypothetical protein IAA20_03990 [Candidatus Enterococcus avicola]|uniref:Uncharacterized protein n=1 Tax=Candidatus Enterococcus avicola TaxID=2838561 RepID=A0A9D2F753_9ENTE|nr:hypothetical protein [Candidatus Enterococcus avicola]
MFNTIGNSYDNQLAEPNSELFAGRKFFRTDEYGEEQLRTTFKPKTVHKDDDLFIVFVKKSILTVIFDLDEVYKKTNQYLVHAEDIAEFVFDEKDTDLIWSCEPVKGWELLQ